MNPSRLTRRQVLGTTAALAGGTVAAGWSSESARAATTEHGTTDQTAQAQPPRACLEFDARAYVELQPEFLHTQTPTYPRIKRMHDGRYLLLYQDLHIGWNIYWSTSHDLQSWTDPQKLYASYPITVGGERDDRAYSTADAAVLHNGDILTVVSYRASANFYKNFDVSGLALRRSRDHGATWDDEQVAYIGPNWEPAIYQTTSGEVQIYFTNIAPKMALEDTPHSSGVGLIRSFDNGYTWHPDVTGYPYEAQRVAQQYSRTTDDGVKVFTDQMPGVVETGALGRIAMAMESQFPEMQHSQISMAYTRHDWPDHLSLDEIGPTDHVDKIFQGAAPSMDRFPSGETVLAYNTLLPQLPGDRQWVRLGDRDARVFGEPNSYLPGEGYWGDILVTDKQTAVASMAKSISSTKKSIMIGTLRLNRAIRALKAHPGHARHITHWPPTENCFFVGSDSQAQAIITAAKHRGRLHLVCDRRDRALTPADRIDLFLTGKHDRIRITLAPDGITQVARWVEGEYRTAPSSLLEAKQLKATAEDSSMWELSITPSAIRPAHGVIRFAVVLYNDDGDGKETIDTLVGIDPDDPATWLDIEIA